MLRSTAALLTALALTAACGGDDDGPQADALPDAAAPTDTDTAEPPDVAPGDAAEPADVAPSDTAEPPDVAPDAATADTAAPDALPLHDPDSLFDLAALGDPTRADCAFAPAGQQLAGGALLDTWTVTYRSVEWVDGAPRPILIRAFAARRADAGDDAIPGVVVAHGLGGAAKLNDAVDAAARLRVVALAYTGPGGGAAADGNASEGLASGHASGYRMFDVLTDVRGSWFWAHTAAALRALTCLAARPGVDPDRLGMTGYSAGAVATLLATGVDPRIKAAVPLSGTGGWDVATESPHAWQHALLEAAGLTTASPEWTTLIDALDATAVVPGATGATLLVNGSTDEFFPLTAHVATYDALGGDKRTAIAANFDHGCYALTGVEAAANIEARALIRANGGQEAWFGHHFGTDPRFAALPAEPTMTLTPLGAVTQVVATVDESPAGLTVDKVTMWASDNASAVYFGVDLERSGLGVWQGLAPGTPSATLISYVDVQYRTAGLTPTRFALASRPAIPAGLVPSIRRIDSCLLP